MADLGAISSWVAAGISLGALGITVGRAWWTRPQVDWSLEGKLGWPNYTNPEAEWLEGKHTFHNFGDGPAHRVSVHIQRGDAPRSQVLETSPLVKPGDAIEFEAGCLVQHLDATYVWVTWTPPPIRRRREATSKRFRILDHVTLTNIADEKLKTWRKRQPES